MSSNFAPRKSALNDRVFWSVSRQKFTPWRRDGFQRRNQPENNVFYPDSKLLAVASSEKSQKNYRANKRSLSKEERKQLRSRMHDFRRRPEDLKPEQTQALEALFERVPLLGVIYHLRWSATQIFDTAPDRATAARALDEWIAEARETGMDWEPFITMLKNHWDGILA